MAAALLSTKPVAACGSKVSVPVQVDVVALTSTHVISPSSYQICA